MPCEAMAHEKRPPGFGPGPGGDHRAHEFDHPAGRVHHRQRDLFPLPRLSEAAPRTQASPHACRTTRRRALRQGAIDTATDELVDALNEMCRAPRGGSPRPASRPTLAQRLALEHLRQRVVDLGPPPEDLDGPGTFDELQSELAYDGASSRLAPLRVDLLDLPLLASTL